MCMNAFVFGERIWLCFQARLCTLMMRPHECCLSVAYTLSLLTKNPSLKAAHDEAQKVLDAATQQQKSRCESNCVPVFLNLLLCFCVSLYFPYSKHHLLSCLCLFAVPQMQNTPFSQSLASGGKPNLSTVTTVSPPMLTQQQVPPQQPPQQSQVPPQGPPAPNQQPPLAPQPMPTNQQTPPTTQPGMVRLEKCISVNTDLFGLIWSPYNFNIFLFFRQLYLYLQLGHSKVLPIRL